MQDTLHNTGSGYE